MAKPHSSKGSMPYTYLSFTKVKLTQGSIQVLKESPLAYLVGEQKTPAKIYEY